MSLLDDLDRLISRASPIQRSPEWNLACERVRAALIEQQKQKQKKVQQLEATIAELQAKKCRTWAQGVVWAAAELVRAHGEDTYAEWLLRLGVESDDFSSCAEEDLSVLREAFPSKKIPRGLE